MSTLTLEVECMAGASIRECIEDALDLCQKLDIGYVKFNFNGTEVHVGQGCVVSLALCEWENKGNNKTKYYTFN